MYKFVCEACANEWYIVEDKKRHIQVCPFCLHPVPIEEEIIVDSFEKAILKTIKDLGVDCLKERSKFIGYLLDTSPSFKKEIKILSNACSSDVLHTFYNTKGQDREVATTVFSQVQLRMVDEEGIAEQWAKVICESLLNAIHPSKNAPTTPKLPLPTVPKPVVSAPSTQRPNIKKGDKIRGTIVRIDGNCAELDIGTYYSAFMLFSDEILRARLSRGGDWGVGTEIEAYVVDVNDEYKTVELIMRNEKPASPSSTAESGPKVTVADKKPPSRISTNSFVGFDAGFSQPPKRATPEHAKPPICRAPEREQSEFVLKGSTLIKYTGTTPDVVIPEGVTAIGFRAFCMNNRLKNVTMPSTLASIEMEAFSYCSQLTTINFNDKLWQIGIKAFSECISLKTLHLSDSIQVLGVEAFSNCIELEEVKLPRKLPVLHEKVFIGCDKIKTVIVPEVSISIADGAFSPTVKIVRE